MLDAVLISFLVYLYVGISTKVLPCEITMVTESLGYLDGNHDLLFPDRKGRVNLL
jgi:hypothetical protein